MPREKEDACAISLRRHSGARRSRERGIHIIGLRVWIPGSPLSRRPGMTTERTRPSIHRYLRALDDVFRRLEQRDQVLLQLCARYRVWRVYVDPWQLADMTQRLSKKGIRIEAYPQTVPNLTRSGQALFDLLNGRTLLLYRAPDLRQQALQTVAVESSRGWRIAKEKSSHKIDAIVALSMACVGALQDHSPLRFAPVGE